MGLKTLWLKIKGDDKGLKSSLKSSEGAVNKFKKTILKLGAAIGIAFGLREIVRFGKEVVSIASKAEGVRRAFEKLGDPKLLQSLRDATRGTVDDLTLMQKAVQAKNFKIPLDQLATYFKFATNRAIETGESVDYLVDSIITGIGRKSVLVMDNLGISAVELQEETKRLGDFGAAAGAIIAREIEKAGDVADTSATKIASLNTMWQNMKERIGTAIIESGLLEKALIKIEGVLIDIISLFDQEMADSLKSKEELLKEANDEMERMKQIQGFINDKQDKINKRLKLGLNATAAQSSYLITQYEYFKKHEERLREILALVKAINKERDIGAAPGGGKAATKRTVPTKLPGRGLSSMAPAGIDPTVLKDMGSAVNQYANDIWGLVDAIVALGSEASPALQEFANQMLAWQELVIGVRQAVVNLATDIAETLGEAIGKALAQGNFDDLGKDLLMNFADFLSQLGGLMVAYGTSIMAFSLLSKSPDPISAGLAIAAGLAAIAIAGAIKGAISGAGKSLGGGGGSYGGSYAGSTGGNNIQAYTSMIQVEGTLKGSDIVIASKRYTDKRNVIT